MVHDLSLMHFSICNVVSEVIIYDYLIMFMHIQELVSRYIYLCTMVPLLWFTTEHIFFRENTFW